MKSNLVRAFELAGWLLVILVVLLLFALPLLTALLIKAGQMPLAWLEYLAYVETVQAYLMRGLGVVWIFFLGGCFASFLNVVAWRVPRGRGINGSSMCPFCETKLKFSDNLPIFGWIRNGGQCSNCGVPISPRYLIVEIILGSIFLLVCGVQILGGGANLPVRAVEPLQGFEHLVFAPKWDLIQLTIYHLVLICLLFTFALIRSERLRIPVSIFVTGLVLGIGLPLVWPSMLLVSWQIDIDHLFAIERFSFDQMLTISFGLVGGLACGVLVSWSTFNSDALRADRSLQSTIEQFYCVDNAVAGMILVGLFLGWHSAFSVAILTLAIHAVVAAFSSRRVPTNLNLSTQMLVATLFHLLAWRLASWIEYWPSPTASKIVMIASAGLMVGAAIAMRIGLHPKKDSIVDDQGVFSKF